MRGEKAINIPKGVEIVTKEKGIIISGPLGTLKEKTELWEKIEIKNNELKIRTGKESEEEMRGTIKARINNMIEGVTEGHERNLIIEGIGYRIERIKEDELAIYVGKSHSIKYKLPKEIKIEINGDKLTIKGIEKELVTKVAAEIREIKKAEPYKGKGIRYEGEITKRKSPNKK